jgi:purine-binding chemotaxis protein CheW
MKTEKIKEKNLLVFRLADEEFGVDISFVREVFLGNQTIYHISQIPDFIEGVIKLRNHLVAVINLRKRFNIKTLEDNHEQQIIICKINKFVVGIIVDSISEIVCLPEVEIQSAPDIIPIQLDNGYVSGIVRSGERIITVLNLEDILLKHEIARLPEIGK